MNKPDVIIDGEASETDNEDAKDDYRHLSATVESVSQIKLSQLL